MQRERVTTPTNVRTPNRDSKRVAAEYRANRAKTADERYRYRVKQVLPPGYCPER